MGAGLMAQVVTKSGATIKFNSRMVQCPSGRTYKTARFPGLRYIAKWAQEGFEKFVRDLEGLGLTAEDVMALAESPDPVAKQLMTKPEDRVRCAVCNRVLWDSESIRRGIGPECWRRR